MKMKQFLFFVVLALGIVGMTSCYKENLIAKDLQGTWRIDSIRTTNTSVIQPDSLAQFLEFLECKKAYTSNCMLVYTVGVVSDTLRYTLKDEELDVIDANSPVPNFNLVFKDKRFFIGNLTDTDLELFRYNDTLTIFAIKQ